MLRRRTYYQPLVFGDGTLVCTHTKLRLICSSRCVYPCCSHHQTCTVCKETFHSHKFMQYHMRKMHGGTVTSQPAASSASSSSTTVAAAATADFHKCECNEVFSNKNQLRIHKTSRCRLKPVVATAAAATAKTAVATATVLDDVIASCVACKFALQRILYSFFFQSVESI